MQAQEKMTFQLNGKTIEFNISQEEMYVEYAENQKSAVQRKLPKGFHNINLNRFRNGIYLIKFSYGNLKGTKKIIKN